MIELDTIYKEDCLIGMQRIPDASIDMILCDLPYGVLNRRNEESAWDRVIPMEQLWTQYLRITKPNAAIVLFAQGMFTANLMMSQKKLWRYNLVWKKANRITGFLNANRAPLRNHEDIVVFYQKPPTYNPQMTIGAVCHTRNKRKEGQTNRCFGDFKVVPPTISNEKYPISVLEFAKEHPAVHPTQKPVAMCEWLIRTFTNEGETVLDNCVGSGTTAVASIRTGRRFIAFENTDKYWELSTQRAKKEVEERRNRSELK